MTITTEYRIYVASLSDYNAGIHHGAWVDFEECSSVDDVWNAINQMLTTSPGAASTGMPAVPACR